MPVLTRRLSPAGAPVVEVFIGLGAAHAAALAGSARPVRAPVLARALVDTGAKRTCVDPAILTALGIVSSGATRVRTVSSGTSSHAVRLFDVSLAAGAPPAFLAPQLAVVEASLAGHGVECLLGRDALVGCLFTYDGPAGQLSLTF